MIISKLNGGLGNQLFQYAAGLSLSLDCESDFWMDLSWFRKTKEREFGLDWFSISAKESKVEGLPLTSEKTSLMFRPLPKKDCVLSGYWQSEKYFSHNRKTIVREFTPKEKVDTPVCDVGLHIRRGDFLRLKRRKGALPEDYHKTSIQRMRSLLGDDISFLIISDDPNYARSSFSEEGFLVFDSGSPQEDLWAMSRCRHQVIVNSSFSWWAAWLNPNPDKVVLYPPLLANDLPPVDDTDYIPESWK